MILLMVYMVDFDDLRAHALRMHNVFKHFRIINIYEYVYNQPLCILRYNFIRISLFRNNSVMLERLHAYTWWQLILLTRLYAHDVFFYLKNTTIIDIARNSQHTTFLHFLYFFVQLILLCLIANKCWNNLKRSRPIMPECFMSEASPTFALPSFF